MRNPLDVLAGAWNALRTRVTQYTSRYAVFGRGFSGVRVSHESAMQVAAVWACIDCIASALSSTDWNVYEGVRGEDRKKALPNDGLHYMLNARFNDEMTAQSGKRALMIAAVGFGNGVAEVERDLAGRIIGLWPLDPTRVELRRYADTGRLFYRFHRDQGGVVDLDPSEVFHIRGAGLTGSTGDDPIGRAIQSISWAVALDQFGAAYFANGAQPGSIIKVPNLKRMPEPEYRRLQEQWAERHQGPRKSFRVGFLDSSMTMEKGPDVDAEKAQLVQVKHLSIEEICRWFRVPPHKIAHLLRATNNNIEHQGLEFSRDTIRPWKCEIEQECDWSLIPMRGPKKFIELDVDWMEQGDYGVRATAYSTLRGCGVFTVNDVLRKLGENTGGPECDVRTMNGASMPLEDVGKNMVPNQRQQPRRADDGGDGDNDVLEAWVQSVYARIQRRMENRRADLERAGRGDVARAAQLDAMQYIPQALEELMPALLARSPDARRLADFGALAVVRGATPAVAAADLMRTLERSRPT